MYLCFYECHSILAQTWWLKVKDIPILCGSHAEYACSIFRVTSVLPVWRIPDESWTFEIWDSSSGEVKKWKYEALAHRGDLGPTLRSHRGNTALHKKPHGTSLLLLLSGWVHTQPLVPFVYGRQNMVPLIKNHLYREVVPPPNTN